MLVLKSIAFVASIFSVVNAAAIWTYGSQGEDWGHVNPICISGKQQSPIDIDRKDTQLSSDININVGVFTNFLSLNIFDKGYTVQGNFPDNLGSGRSFTRTFFGGETVEFQAVQMHLHAPSEHTIEGYHFDAELHIVHLYPNGTLGGVLAMLFDRQLGGFYTNDLIDQIIDPVPTTKPGNPREIDLKTYLEGVDTSKFYAYPGSLTTPPCTEGIEWNILHEIQPLTTEQHDKFMNYWKYNPEFSGTGNYRLPQPRNGRIVQTNAQPKGWGTLIFYTGADMLATTTLAAFAVVGTIAY